MAINGIKDTSLLFNGGILNIQKKKLKKNKMLVYIYLRKETIFNDRLMIGLLILIYL